MIVGIDTGAKRLAVCELWETGEVSFGYYETPETELAEVLKDLCYWLTQRSWIWRRKDRVYLEKVVQPHGARATSFDGMMAHSMTIGMVVSTVGGVLITPATWKAAILGYGHADKDDTELWLTHSAPQVAAAVEAAAPTRKDRRADLRDAYGIAAYGDLARRHPDSVDPGRRVPRRRGKPKPG